MTLTSLLRLVSSNLMWKDSMQRQKWLSKEPTISKKKRPQCRKWQIRNVKNNIMENSNDKKEKVGIEQRFYFNEDGKLVVESNKGVWVDGQQFVKMYGVFTCNAKTMGKIIHAMQGTPVEIGMEEVVTHTTDVIADEILHLHKHTLERYCVLGVDKKRIDDYVQELATGIYNAENVKSLRRIEEQHEQAVAVKENIIECYADAISRYNELPRWKRWFKKIKVQLPQEEE